MHHAYLIPFQTKLGNSRQWGDPTRSSLAPSTYASESISSSSSSRDWPSINFILRAYSGILHINIVLPLERPSPPLVQLWLGRARNPYQGPDNHTGQGQPIISQTTLSEPSFYSPRLHFLSPCSKSREQEANFPAASDFTSARGASVVPRGHSSRHEW